MYYSNTQTRYYTIFIDDLAKRGVTIELGEPWGSITIERGMTPLKFYHDFNCEVQHYSYAFGPCWEPVIAQCNLCKFFEFLNLQGVCIHILILLQLYYHLFVLILC